MNTRCMIFLLCLLVAPLFSIDPPSKPSQWDNWNFDQKVQWRGENLDPRIPYAPLVDKLHVKKIVQGEVATAKVYLETDDPAQICMENLPQNFIMKANNASGRGILVKNGMILATKKRERKFVPKACSDEVLRSYASKWLTNLYREDKEKQYALIKPMIFFEEFLEDISMEIELYFFNGKVRVIALFFVDGYTKNPRVSYYDENWNALEVTHPKFVVNHEPIQKPPYMDKLIAFGELFAEKIDHVRIDFFVTNEEVYFGEFTFTTGGGYQLPHLNKIVGNYWSFPDPTDPLVNPVLNELLLRANPELHEIH